jgi:hypothetical protein
MTIGPGLPPPEQAAPAPRARGSVGSLLLFLFISLLFCLAMGQTIVFNYDTTVGLWIGWTVAWGVIWVAFAVLQIVWWSKGYEKFWRPVYSWTLLGYIVISLIFLPFLLWPRFRRWLFRVIKPTDPPRLESPTWDATLRTLAQLRDDGILTPEEFAAKKQDVLRQA